MTLNGVMAVILRYFSEFGSFPHHVSGINFLILSVNLIPVPLSLTSLLMLLPHLLTLSTYIPLSPSITPSLFHSRLKTYLFPQIFPTIDPLPASGLTPRLHDWSVSFEHLGFLFLFFFISLFCCGSVRQIKLAICWLLGARKSIHR